MKNPLEATSLDDFIVNKRMSNLPTNLDDDIGRLMRKVQHSVKSIDELNKEKKDMLDIIPIDIIKDKMRHSSIDVTMKANRKHDKKRIEEQLNRIDR
jgi:hypothetical protein